MRCFRSFRRSLGDLLFAIESYGVLSGEEDQHEHHSSQANGSPEIKQFVISAEKMYLRLPQKGQVADRQQHAEFGWPEAPERQPELAERVGRQIGLNRQHEERDQQADRD